MINNLYEHRTFFPFFAQEAEGELESESVAAAHP